jgi:3',5'-cyclic AMP phosphodiesterase CpdA
MHPKHLTSQLVIIHLSDIHFGSRHRFNPPPAPSGGVPARTGYPTLLEKLAEDLDGPDPSCPVIIAITGDLATTAGKTEFDEAESFINRLAATAILGRPRGLESIFLVPGNHDVSYTDDSIKNRLSGFAQLLSSLEKKFFDAAAPWKWQLVHDRFDSLGAIILCLNSSIYVQKDKPDQDRGHVDVEQLSVIERELKSLPADHLTRAVKIALIHHHPVLIPALAEPGRGYDAVLNSGKLLTILRRFGFHAVLHGHKHDPYVFTEDSKSAFSVSQQNPIVVVAGGSVASTELPLTRSNCYNRISIKWHPASGQARILTETVALSVLDEDGNEALPANWAWHVISREDRHFLRGNCIPRKATTSESLPRNDSVVSLERRSDEYSRLRGNMPCVEVRPSLWPSQGYEAIVWIVPHKRKERDVPREVVWSAGQNFKNVTKVTRKSDPRFCAEFNYWGPMLIQASLFFDDEKVENGFIYARIPEDCSEDANALKGVATK